MLPFCSIVENSVDVAIKARNKPNVPINMASPDCKLSTHCLTVNEGSLSSLPKKVTPRMTPFTASMFIARPIVPTINEETIKKNRNILFRNDSRNVSKKMLGLNIACTPIPASPSDQ